MAKRVQVGVVAVAAALAAWGTVLCGAQNTPAANPAPCAVAPQPEPCGTKAADPDKSSTADKFPFPGEDGSPSATAPDAAQPSISGVPDAPDLSPGAAPAGKKDAGKEFPFPGEASQPDSNAGANGGSSSSSSSAGDNPFPVDPGASADGNSGAAPGAGPGLNDKGSEGSTATPGRHILHRVNPPGTKLQSPEEREAEDLSVAHFYTETGDLQGAYLRSQDAVKIAPADPDAHFMLAEIALKLQKRDEAIAEYNACLKLDPTDRVARESRKALERLKP